MYIACMYVCITLPQQHPKVDHQVQEGKVVERLSSGSSLVAGCSEVCAPDELNLLYWTPHALAHTKTRTDEADGYSVKIKE